MSQDRPRYSLSSATGSDPDELSEILSTPRSPIRVFAPRREPVSFSCNFISLGDIGLADCSYEGTLVTERDETSDKMLVFLPTRGNASYIRGGEEICSVPGRGAIFEPHRTVGATWLFGPRRHLGLFVNQAKITEYLTHSLERTICGNLDIQPQIDLTDGAGLALVQLVRRLHGGLGEDGLLVHSPLARRSLCDAAIYLLLENYSMRYSEELSSPALAPAPRHVKWAIDFMHAHIAQPISLNEIASAAKVSVRTLQQGFRQFRNTSPMCYLHDIRLNAVHEELSLGSPGTTVAEVAVKWGFTHLGRFAANYRKRFGQAPSQTVKQSTLTG